MDNSKGAINNELKIIVVGSSGTGKTSFVNKWTKNIYNDNYKPTIVSEFSYKIHEYKDKSYKIQLWDLAGMDQNICLTKIFSKDSQGCIVLSDITQKGKLDECVKWKQAVDESTKFYDNTNLPSILIRNKVDLLDNDDINDDEDEMRAFCEKNKFLRCFKTSAKTGTNIEEAMNFLINTIIEKIVSIDENKDNFFFDEQEEEKMKRHSIILDSKNHIQNNKESNDNECCAN